MARSWHRCPAPCTAPWSGDCYGPASPSRASVSTRRNANFGLPAPPAPLLMGRRPSRAAPLLSPRSLPAPRGQVRRLHKILSGQVGFAGIRGIRRDTWDSPGQAGFSGISGIPRDKRDSPGLSGMSGIPRRARWRRRDEGPPILSQPEATRSLSTCTARECRTQGMPCTAPWSGASSRPGRQARRSRPPDRAGRGRLRRSHRARSRHDRRRPELGLDHARMRAAPSRSCPLPRTITGCIATVAHFVHPRGCTITAQP